ncbi:golgi-body localization protein domain-containing protein [Crucibulum laeve]|uniref:Golgi-body localization protein domain-containing protein n=1 Tax=Crucibulum laeve TaxID=68775 RepID=A0A5C3MDA6_9AGAR|nr:golgi-body localization protein domain-containing protein [Crucibulum laeve]
MSFTGAILSLLSAIWLILCASPHNIWLSVILWSIRITTFSLLFRTYIGPWLLATLSSHVRVRSISLRSVRGVYFRKGAQTWRVERVSYKISSLNGSRRLAVRIDGLSLDIGKDSTQTIAKPIRRHHRNLTLADLNPSPLARWLWQFSWKLYAVVEPFFRPLIRSCVVACMRVAIRWLPGLAEAVTFDFHSTSVTLSEIPGTRVGIEEISLHTTLQFTHMETMLDSGVQDHRLKPLELRGAYGVGAMKRRMIESFQRSLDRAWGQAHGTATMTLKLHDIAGTTHPDSPLGGYGRTVPFFLSPGAIDLGVSVRFNPRAGFIDPHSIETTLSVGDCTIKVDLVNTLLGKLKPLTVQNITAVESPPASPYPGSPLSTFSFLSPQSSTFSSPALSMSQSLMPPHAISPTPSILGVDSAKSLSPNSLKAPSSPFLRALSASMRPRRRYYIQRCSKLKDYKNVSSLSIVRCINISISTITLSTVVDCGTGSYKAVIQDISAGIRLSDPGLDPLHNKWFGRDNMSDNFDSDIYAFRFSVHMTTLERQEKHEITRLLRIGSLEVQAIASQWPSPLLVVSPFMRGDPNAAFLGLHVNLASIQLGDRLDCLKQIVKSIPTPEQRNSPPEIPITPYAMPKVAVELHCGPVCGKVMCGVDHNSRPYVLELRSRGFVASAVSQFNHFVPATTCQLHSVSGDTLMQMDCTYSVDVEPVLIRVRSKWTPVGLSRRPGPSDQDFLDDPAIISLEILEIRGSVKGLANIDSRMDGVASVDRTSLLLEGCISTEALCVELWHPDVIATTVHLVSNISSPQERVTTSPPPRTLSRMPVGSIQASLQRFVVFITAPDINPQDELEMFRGAAFRTGISVDYSYLQFPHVHRVDDSLRMQARSKLHLPEETIVDAVVAGRRATTGQDTSAFIKLSAVNAALRSAIATEFEPDDPTIAGRDDTSPHPLEFLHIGRIQVGICLSSEASSSTTEIQKIDISMNILDVSFDFLSAHIYSLLLGLQTVRKITSALPSRPRTPEPKANSNVIFTGTITTTQIIWNLPKQKLFTRLDGLTIRTAPNISPIIRLDRVGTSVSLPGQVSPWEEGPNNKWEELLALNHWEIRSHPYAQTLSVVVEAEGARIRIPHGFIMSELIHDISVTLKGLRHINYMTAAGTYSDMPSPVAEGPKSIPYLVFNIHCVCLEAVDDPFEAKLGMIWREGTMAARQRLEREDAFLAKVAAIQAAESNIPTDAPENDQDYQFDSKHSVSIEEARQRLNDVHMLDWTLRLERAREHFQKEQDALLHKLQGTTRASSIRPVPNLVPLSPLDTSPPLFRSLLHGLSLRITPPSFPATQIHDFLYVQGGGLPLDTQFSLLVPMHVNFTLSGLKVSLRDYPLPLVNITQGETTATAFDFDSDIVIAEEMGTEKSVDWVNFPILDASDGAAPLSLSIPKTIMPVKSYASPIVKVTTPHATVLSWGVSYGPAIQDLMRIIDTLSSSPRDPSPVMGFWDKMRLVFHWNLLASFAGDVRLYLKGSRDPYDIRSTGAGFVLSWQGAPELRVGYKNDQRELIQVTSKTMCIAIPNLENVIIGSLNRASEDNGPFRKVCAKFGSGIRFGIGFVLERACGYECTKCTGSALQRQCRYFTFRPHYSVKLEKKPIKPTRKGLDDSYNGFRSDFIHLSVSLVSSLRTSKTTRDRNASNLHLTPKAFAHFFSWWSLFDSVLSLPIRQGSYYPHRSISPKLGRHLATLKYQICVRRLFIMHGYIDDSRETWVDGVTPWVGVKGMIDEFQADMHQRDEEAVVAGPAPNTTKTVRRKPFYAAEVVLRGLDLRAFLATFVEPLKQVAQISAPSQRSNYRKHNDLPNTPLSSVWYDSDDFIEIDWTPQTPPKLHHLPLASCPHFTYFKRNSAAHTKGIQTSKFGLEHSHVCLLGKEPSVPEVQMTLATARITELQKLAKKPQKNTGGLSLEKMVALLEEYISILRETASESGPSNESTHNYHMPSDVVSSDEWAEFDNVYQIHCPNIFMDSATRDIILQYYYCSRARKGFEYHMATRAVKFIRDQADAALADDIKDDPNTVRDTSNIAQQLATATLRKILKNDVDRTSIEISNNLPDNALDDPLQGWADGVSLRKSHCCLLLKPQIVLRGEGTREACILAAAQAKMQSFAIMDIANLDDPISGKVMSRNYTSLSGLQAFSTTRALHTGDGRVPLEVLIDLRCESNEFERLVPQTDATFHYDKFNRLRLRNNVTSVVARTSTEKSSNAPSNHLQDQTDLIRVHIPRFTVSANDEHFQTISNVVTKLLLFSDAAHKTRLDKLETLLFTYDFTDLESAANVVSSLQSRLRDAMETERMTMSNSRRLEEEEDRLGLMKLKAHIFLLAEELNFLFDAIKLVQDRFDDQADQKSALLLHASSSEISWRMLDDRRNLLAKLVVQESHFYWLSRQDSSTANNLAIGNLTAFDGSRHAIWAEILSKHYEPANHPLLKRGLFLVANWTILPPVGGITIYEVFEMSLHPLRLQIDSKVGHRIMEYVWPARRQRDETAATPITPKTPLQIEVKSPVSSRSSLDSPRALHAHPEPPKSLIPPLRKLGSSRSFTDLRAVKDSGFLRAPILHRTHSSNSLKQIANTLDSSEHRASGTASGSGAVDEEQEKIGDAAVMKTRSSQKTFVLVKISSLDLLLSIVKEGSFECHDARIRTRELEYRNQTWSFEELVNQFIPSNMSWTGWVKMAFHQPLLPVLPVARELISKTKWTASSKGGTQPHDHPLQLLHPSRILASDDDFRLGKSKSPSAPHTRWGKVTGKGRHKTEAPTSFTSLPLTAEPEPINSSVTSPSSRSSSRKRVLSLFSRGSSHPSKSDTTVSSRYSEESPSSSSTSKAGNSDNNLGNLGKR